MADAAGGVDTSIYGNLLKAPSPLEAMSTFASVNNSLVQNRLLNTASAVKMQQFKANRAMGPIMQQSVGPNGEVDYDKAATLMASNPDTAFMAPDFLIKAFQGKGLQLDAKLKEFSTMAARQKIYADTAASLLPLGEGVKSADVAKALGRAYGLLAQNGLANNETQDQFIGLMGNLPQEGKPLYDTLHQIAQTAAGAADGLNRVTGSFQVFNIGGKQVLGYTNPANKSVQYAGELTNTPTPGQLNEPIPTTDAAGNISVGPAAASMPMFNGAGQQINPPGGGAPQGPAPAQPQAGPIGSSATPGPQAQAPAPAPAMAPTSRAMQKLGPETAGFLASQGANAGEYYKNLTHEVSGIQSQLQMLHQIQSISKDFHPGAGASQRTALGELAQAVGMPQDIYDKIANGSLSASQAFSKYTVQNTMNVLRQAIGGQGRLTNLEFEQFLHSNPNIDTDPRAIDKILQFSDKLFKIKIAEQKGFNSWIKSGHAPSDFPTAWTQKLMERGILREAKDSDLSAPQNWKFGNGAPQAAPQAGAK